MKTNKSSSRVSFFSASALTVLGLAIASSAGCAVDAEPMMDENVGSSVMTWEEFLEGVHQESDTGIYIVDGDIPLYSERELELFYVQNVLQKNALAVYSVGNVDVKWNDTQKVNITYCVSSSSFGSRYDTVVAAMANAAAAWEAAANVNFIHKSDQDSSCTATNTNVVFDVRQVSGGAYLARAFFPNSSRSGRNVLIDSSSFGTITPWTLTGILRHELGHGLGFRHEHTRPEAASCYEDNQWRELTPYDSASVMHYPQCSGTQTGDLVLTQKDKDGAAALYGTSLLPSGSYQQSCSACSANGGQLSCSCRDTGGNSVSTSVGLPCSASDIANCNGNLTCGSQPQPSGSYQQSCFGCSVNGCSLQCQCFNMSGNPVNTTLGLPCASAVANCNGQLKCGGC